MAGVCVDEGVEVGPGGVVTVDRSGVESGVEVTGLQAESSANASTARIGERQAWILI
jgi:hypothetical protein